MVKLIVRDKEKPLVLTAKTQTPNRWCVDSGANRDLCKDFSLAGGQEKPCAIPIGEAGEGHSFLAEAVGPISFKHNNEQLPLFSRTIFARKVSENIMSVSEAVDKGYKLLFEKSGVKMFREADINIKASPVLSGTRDPQTRLFYLDFTQRLGRGRNSNRLHLWHDATQQIQ